MPQFLRAVRALCNLYPLYRQALQRSEITLVNPGARSLPTSPAIAAPNASELPGLNVQRAGSFGSLLDGGSHPRTHTVPAVSTGVQPPTRRDHRRTHSQTLPPDEMARTLGEQNGKSPSGTSHPGGGGGGRRLVLEDPFTGLQAVWSSLESWFDLILAEIERTNSTGSVERGRDLLKRRMESIEGTSTAKPDKNATKTDTVPPAMPPTTTEGEGGARKSRTGPKLTVPQSNRVAVEIVKTTPVERRMAYLG